MISPAHDVDTLARFLTALDYEPERVLETLTMNFPKADCPAALDRAIAQRDKGEKELERALDAEAVALEHTDNGGPSRMKLETPITVYVPDEGNDYRIDAKSGIVGSPATPWLHRKHNPEMVDSVLDLREKLTGPQADAELVLDFEGNRYHASNVKTFADRVMIAAGRHTTHYPTVARLMIPAGTVLEVGTFDGERVSIEDGRALYKLAEWLGLVSDNDAIDTDTLHAELVVTR